MKYFILEVLLWKTNIECVDNFSAKELYFILEILKLKTK